MVDRDDHLIEMKITVIRGKNLGLRKPTAKTLKHTENPLTPKN